MRSSWPRESHSIICFFLFCHLLRFIVESYSKILLYLLLVAIFFQRWRGRTIYITRSLLIGEKSYLVLLHIHFNLKILLQKKKKRLTILQHGMHIFFLYRFKFKIHSSASSFYPSGEDDKKWLDPPALVVKDSQLWVLPHGFYMSRGD